MSFIRKAHVAGQFYPDTALELQKMVQGFLKNATVMGTGAQKALIVPHAGYVYSGQVAAEAYAQIRAHASEIKKVVLLGPCHRVAVKGFALSDAQGFETPLGVVAMSSALKKAALELPGVKVFEETHIPEHSLEVQLPFLQEILPSFELLPVVVGQTAPETVARFLDHVWGGPETLIVISTDLSHYLSYDSCQKRDDQTALAIDALKPDAISQDQACGRIPLKGLLSLAHRRKMKVKRLSLLNSGDTQGPKDRVVGYGAWCLAETLRTPPHQTNDPTEKFSKEMHQLLRSYGATLLQIAAASLKRGLSHGEPIKIDLESFPDMLKQDGACFVTLERADGSLRGCIGSLQAHQPLVCDLAQNAFKAAFKDPRFKPVGVDEYRTLCVHLSFLSPAYGLSFKDEADFMDQIRPGRDGIIIRDQGKQALFLPSVWEKLPDKTLFMRQLKQKAGMASNHWSKNFQAFRFITEGVRSQQLDDPQKLWQ